MTLYPLFDAMFLDGSGSTAALPSAKEHTPYGQIYKLEKLYNCEPWLSSERPIASVQSASINPDSALSFSFALCECVPAY